MQVRRGVFRRVADLAGGVTARCFNRHFDDELATTRRVVSCPSPVP